MADLIATKDHEDGTYSYTIKLRLRRFSSSEIKLLMYFAGRKHGSGLRINIDMEEAAQRLVADGLIRHIMRGDVLPRFGITPAGLAIAEAFAANGEVRQKADRYRPGSGGGQQTAGVLR